MNEKIQNLVLVIGGYPPPYGGVTIHIQRFLALCQENNFPIQVVSQFDSTPQKKVVNLKGNRFIKLIHLLVILLKFKGKLIHIHVSAFSNFVYGGFLIIFFAVGKIKILTVHGGQFKIPENRNTKKAIYKHLLSKFDYIVCINKEQKKYFKNILEFDSKKLPVIPSYIPIRKSQIKQTSQFDTLLKEIKAKSDFVVFSSGYLTETYGFDLLIDAVKEIGEFKIGIILAFYTHENFEYKKKLNKIIKTYPLIWQFENIESDDFLFLIKHSDLLVRPSRADTYGMVIGDSINLGVPAIASDVCDRYPGTILCKKNNSNDLKKTLIKTIKDIQKIKYELSKKSGDNFGNNLLNFYNRILFEK